MDELTEIAKYTRKNTPDSPGKNDANHQRDAVSTQAESAGGHQMMLVSVAQHFNRDIVVVLSDGTARCFGSSIESNVRGHTDANHGNTLVLTHVDGHTLPLEYW